MRQVGVCPSVSIFADLGGCETAGADPLVRFCSSFWSEILEKEGLCSGAKHLDLEGLLESTEGQEALPAGCWVAEGLLWAVLGEEGEAVLLADFDIFPRGVRAMGGVRLHKALTHEVLFLGHCL